MIAVTQRLRTLLAVHVVVGLVLAIVAGKAPFGEWPEVPQQFVVSNTLMAAIVAWSGLGCANLRVRAAIMLGGIPLVVSVLCYLEGFSLSMRLPFWTTLVSFVAVITMPSVLVVRGCGYRLTSCMPDDDVTMCLVEVRFVPSGRLDASRTFPAECG